MQKQQISPIIIIALLSAALLISAYFIQYFLKVSPCKLCLYQRVPYLIIIIFVLGHRLIIPKQIRFGLIVCAVLLVIEALLAGYHVGVERHFFEYLPCQVKAITGNVLIEQLREQINNNIVDCRDVPMRIVGLSLTELNAIFSLGMLYFTCRQMFCKNK